MKLDIGRNSVRALRYPALFAFASWILGNEHRCVNDRQWDQRSAFDHGTYHINPVAKQWRHRRTRRLGCAYVEFQKSVTEAPHQRLLRRAREKACRFVHFRPVAKRAVYVLRQASSPVRSATRISRQWRRKIAQATPPCARTTRMVNQYVFIPSSKDSQ